MKLEEFKSGSYRQQFRYKSFAPTPVNHLWTWEDSRVNTLLEGTFRALAELDAFSVIVPDIDLITRMHVITEASASSAIEGTQTSVDEALQEFADIDPERRDDWQEVQNYIQAMNSSIAALDSLPLSNRLLKDAHGILLQGARGEHKTPGEFRRSQNWIGGTSLEDAFFIPPHHEEVPELMADLEKFWHNDQLDVPHLVRIAICHYQFETIHPFQDGNGRIGRLLVPLYLIGNGLLRKPSLYLSGHLERNRDKYYDALTTVRASNDLLHWVRFFLVALRETAIRGKSTFEKILSLRSESEQQVLTLGQRAHNARNLLTLLYRAPVVSPNRVAEHLCVSHQTASTLLRKLETLGIVSEMTGHRRNRLYAFRRYISLFSD